MDANSHVRHPKKISAIGEFHRLVQELKLDGARFRHYFRMSTTQSEDLLQIVGPHLYKNRTNYREAISEDQRLAICFRFLAKGDSYRTIAFGYRVGVSTVSAMVEETCEVLWKCLVEINMKLPTEEEWQAIARKLELKWNFPNCIDGKHIVIQAPPNSGSLFYNYKGTFAVVLMALVDADYRFTVIDVGSYGSNSDAGFSLYQPWGGLQGGSLNIPPLKQLVGAEHLGTSLHVIGHIQEGIF
ncbi:protein ALP1-like [Huso huso]|uniref:Protein ALP1-like n=1 Tax=Huso huso TaxID=61971 RepID=A0ABR0ZDP5_HUSHU